MARGALRSRRAKLEGDGRAEVAEIAIRRIVEHDGGRKMLVKCIERRQEVRDVRAKAIVNGKDHSWYASKV